MPNGDKKAIITILQWVIGILITITLALAGFGYNNIVSGQVDLATDIKSLDTKVDSLTSVVGASIMGDSLQGRDILEIKTMVQNHLKGHRP